MMRHALQRAVAKMAGLAFPDHRLGQIEMGEAAQPRQRGGDGRHVRDLVLAQIAGLGARIGDQLFAVAVVEFLGDDERLVRRPAPSLAAGLLERWQVEQLRRPLAAMLDLDAERAAIAISRAGYGLGAEAVLDALLCRRSVTHGETAARHMRLRHDLEIVLGPEIADLQLAQADDAERWRLHPPDADDAARAQRQKRLRRGARQRQVEDLI